MTKVLIIEDDPIIANIYRSRLDKEGFQVEIASDGQTGFYRIHESQPNAILLDLMLPKMDGIQILKKIRAQKAFQNLPVIVFTNAYLPNMIQEATAAGANQVFNKAALTPRQIVDAINRALGGVASTGSEAPPAAAPSPGGFRPPPSTMAPPSQYGGLPMPPGGAAVPSGGIQMPSSAPYPMTPRPLPTMPPTMPGGQSPLQYPSTLRPVPSSAPQMPASMPRPGMPSMPSMPTVPVMPTSPGVPSVPLPSVPAESPLPYAATPAPAPYMPSVPPQASVPEFSSGGDADFQAELLRSFLDTVPDILAALRKTLHEFMKSADDSVRHNHLLELYRKVHAITGNAAIVDLQNIAQMSAAMEALLKELSDKPKSITASTMRTVAHAIDFLSVLFEKGRGPNVLDVPPINILVVDDEIISRRAVIYALDKAKLKSESMEDPLVALRNLEQKSYDLIILDIEMPTMSGFELCSKLRALPTNAQTPVIFVTTLSDFESRAKSSLSGGNDLIAKPFVFIELTVKALMYVLKGRLLQGKG